MLYTIVLGDPANYRDPWELRQDEYCNNFLGKDDIHQRIRLDRRLTELVFDSRPKMNADFFQAFDLPEETFMGFNRNNMNPLLLTKRRNEQPVFVYLILSSETYKMINYTNYQDIVQTFHSKDKYQGCAMNVDTGLFHVEGVTDVNLISIDALNVKTKTYETITLKLRKNERGEHIATMDVEPITNRAVLARYREIVKRNGSRVLGFRVDIKDQLLTNIYVVSDEKYQAVHNELQHTNITKYTIFSISGEGELPLEGNEDFVKQLNDLRIRALTTCGVKLSFDLVRALRLLYIFDYEVKTKKLTCIKTN